jgi:hypothetical protein
VGLGFTELRSRPKAAYPTAMTIPIRGTAALVVAAAIVAATAIWLPAYRWFLLISVGVGVLVAVGLILWHKLRPVKDDDIENKRPLGLS